MKVSILFAREKIKGALEVRDGTIAHLDTPGGKITGCIFELPQGGRLDITLSEYSLKRGAFPTICRVMTERHPFSFNLRDIKSETPIFIPEFGIAVVPGDDSRDYDQVTAAVAARGLVSDFTRFRNEPEESYQTAAARTRKQYCPTWLGLGRDMRLFRVGYQENYKYWGLVQPCYHTTPQSAGIDWQPGATRPSEGAYQIQFEIGHGTSSKPCITRNLEEGCLPILHSQQFEEDITYHLTAFATLEKSPLESGAVRGSDWRACYQSTGGHMTSPEEAEGLRDLLSEELWGREQEVVCCLRIVAVNSGRVPRHAWFRTANIRKYRLLGAFTADTTRFGEGCSSFVASDRVFGVARIDGNPLPESEMAILLQPGESVTFDLLLPHSPLPPERAKALLNLDYESHLEACRHHWRLRLASAASIHVPEHPIDESIRAGLLHCDLVTLGRETEGPLLPTIGPYSPIGTESAPIIQYFDSMGWHSLAERCLDFFFARQRPDGFIQNFANYQSETGHFLWTAGEHYRYTRDNHWLQRVLPQIKKAAAYLLEWRERNKTEKCREQGFYGMVDGKVADPNDFYHSFYLNAGTYLGLKRVAEILSDLDPDYASNLAEELTKYREDIRFGFYHAQAHAPVGPLPDGSWAPIMPPWVEHTGGISLYADGGNWFSHGAFASRSSLTGPLWLILGEVLDPFEEGAEFLLKTNQYPVTLDNAGLSQPYYCRHDHAHLLRGETEAFLKTFYNQLTALQDRETYTFWEHYHQIGEHKTHEEAWFLMQARWMLWREDGMDLHLLGAIPRTWLAEAQSINLRGVKSYFGPIWLDVRSELHSNRITALLKMETNRPPANIILRLPHPERRIAKNCQGGSYQPETEAITVCDFQGEARVSLSF